MQFVLEFDWSRECITPDWSLVAWAEKGEVDIIHAKGKKSDSFPYIERTAEMQDPEEEALRVIAEAKAALVKKAQKKAEAKQAALAAAKAEEEAAREAERAEEARIRAEAIAKEFERWEAQKTRRA